MIEKLVNVFFGCRHSRYSFPVTVRRAKRRPQAAALTGTYVACLDCGKEFPYDWQQMKVITSPERHREQVAELAKHAAEAAASNTKIVRNHEGDLFSFEALVCVHDS